MTNTQNYPGLTSSEASAGLKQFGENVIFQKKKKNPLLLLLDKLRNPLLVLMIAISVVSFFMGQKTSAIIMLMMVTLSSVLDFFNSFKSQKAVDRLISYVATVVTVMRDGQKQEIDIKQIVPGDVVFLSAGAIIPADCEILESDDFFVNQSSLTGESLPIEKIAATNINGNDLNPDENNLVFMGTSVVSGFATVRIIKTGTNTEFGKIAQKLGKENPKTDFELNITKFSLFIMKLVFFMVSFVFVIYLIKNSDSLDKGVILGAFTFAIAITIGVTPDMLPAIITVCLSRGSQRMAKKDVIVKHLSSIENFGSMDILCTDKTGTLTKDKIALVKFIDYLGNESEKVLEFGHLSSHFHTGVVNPLDTAINDFRDIDVSRYKKIDEIPYDFTRKRSSMVVTLDDKRFLITKGAPEEIVKICKQFELSNKLSDYNKQEKLIEKQFVTLSEEGFRALGLCYKELPNDGTIVYDKKIEKDMIFAGFLAFLDPPKEGAKETIDELEELGIEIKILTGDNDLLAQKICRDIGINITGVLTGKDIEKLNDIELSKKVLQTNIFARITPDQKERIILTLKKLGKVVGYLGDGINDAPALKVADVGISVNNAVDIAKETAGIILMQKSLESLKDGVIEGRKTFHNTLKYVLMGLSSNFGNMFSMMGASAFLPFLPMMPAQILLNNFIYDVSQLSLPSDEVDKDELAKPAHWNMKFIRNYMIVFGLISSIFDFLTFFLLYFVYHLNEQQFQTGWFIESIATQIFVIYIIRTKKIPFLQSRPSKPLFLTTMIAVIIAWLVQFTVLGKLIGFEQLPLRIMAIIFSYVIIYLIIVEVSKRVFYRFQKKSSTANQTIHA